MIKAFFFLVIFLSLTAKAQVNFEQATFNEALAKAKSAQKNLFIYFYTDWCAPCKQLDTIVFHDVKIKEWLNSKFICLKVNAEKGEGIMLDSTYNIGAYPTFLFLDSIGSKVGIVKGTRSNEDYLTIIKSNSREDPFQRDLENRHK